MNVPDSDIYTINDISKYGSSINYITLKEGRAGGCDWCDVAGGEGLVLQGYTGMYCLCWDDPVTCIVCPPTINEQQNVQDMPPIVCIIGEREKNLFATNITFNI